MGSSKTPQIETLEWHAEAAEQVLATLTTTERGLSGEEAVTRLEKYGKNSFTEKKPETSLGRFFRQFKSPLTIILLLASVVTFALEEYVDATVILVALLIAVILGVIQEGKASRAFQHLAKSQVRTAIVIRGGNRYEIEAAQLVPGDIVVLQGGMQIPADLRLIETKKLSVNEAPLTGEWMAVAKSIDPVAVGTPFADRTPMAYLGTYVADGHGVGVVVATGDQTAMGVLARDLGAIEDEATPLQEEMERVSRIMLVIIVVLIVGIFFLGLLRGEELGTMLFTAIAVAVAAVPEGLPAAVTIVLAVGMEALLRRGGLVRSLIAAETLGSTTYILTDKTGTLTEARMAVTDLVYVGCEVKEKDGVCDWSADTTSKLLLDTALAATDAFLEEHTNGDESYIVRGEPIERAVLEAAQSVGITVQGDSLRGKRVDYLAFTSEQRYAAGLSRRDEKHILSINGAPELLLERAAHVALPSGGTEEMSTKHRKYFEDMLAKFTEEGKRLIAVSYKEVETEEVPEASDDVFAGSVFMGLIVCADPVRKDVKESILGVQNAGAEVRLVTGDNPRTALAIARSVGIARKHDIALTGDDIAEYSDEELYDVIRSTRVFARVLPKQKMRLAAVLKAHGEVVAMTGDGINDASALRKADIGVAIGSGTEVAKESSDLVLMNDSFSTIYAAIEEGRRIVSNLRRIVGYLLSTSLSEVALIGGALISGGAVPILPAQILWANIIEEGLMSVAFAFEPGDKRAMKEKPQDIHAEGILSRSMIWFMSGVIVVLGLLLLALYAWLRILDVPIEEMRSVMFLAISLDSLFIAFSFRSLKTPVWKIPLGTNKFFLGAFAVNVVLLCIVISVPFFQNIFSYQPLPLRDVLLVFLYFFFIMLIIEGGKWFFFERKK